MRNNQRKTQYIERLYLMKKLRECSQCRARARGLSMPKLLDNAELMQFLKVDRSTLQRMRARGDIGFVNINGRIYYLEQEISEFIMNRYQML